MARTAIFDAFKMKTVFFVTPYLIDQEYALKKSILKDLCTKRNLKLLVAENEITGGSLDAFETVNLISECDFAIADLSYERPSCYYEVGFLQALEKKVYLICMLSTPIHQVLKKENLLIYSNLESYYFTIDKILKDEI